MARGSIGARLAHAWNAFVNDDKNKSSARAQQYSPYYGTWSGGAKPERTAIFSAFDKTILSSIYARLALDFSGVPFRHVRLDDQGRYLEDIDSQLNQCLTVEANLDQAARAFRIDLAFTLFERGYIAIVPVDTTLDPNTTGGFDVKTLRVGWIVDTSSEHVRVEVWRTEKQRREQIVVPKKFVGIVENPLYVVMNEPNSTLKRLVRKLNLLDVVDEASASGKLDLIIQVPYQARSETQRERAEQRRKDIEVQLKGSQYGIAWTDGTERITQLNRPAENNLMGQIEYLVNMLYSQLGLTPEVMNGTADEKTMLNYINRTQEPLLDAVKEEMHRKFLTRTARSQNQAIMYFRDVFKLLPVSAIAEIADTFLRNEVATSNEFRQVLGWKPSKDPKADQLVNSNMSAKEQGLANGVNSQSGAPSGDAFDQIDSALNDAFKTLGVPDAQKPA